MTVQMTATANETWPKLLRATAEVAAAQAHERAQISFRADQSPCPGDTFMLSAGQHPVQWLIVERDPEDARRLLVVPVDDYPQVGSHDLELRPGEQRVANARCNLATWLDAAALSRQRRTGEMPASVLVRLRQKRAEIAADGFTASLLGEEVDGDPEYRQWQQETLQPAVASLQEITKPVVRPRRFRRSLSSGPLAVAASLLLLIAVASTWQVSRVRNQLQIGQQQATRLADEKATLEQDLHETRSEAQALQERLTGLEQESARALNELRQQLQETKQRAVEPNLAFALLRSEDGMRRGPYRLLVERSAKRIALFVPVIDPEYYPAYRLQLVDRGSKSTIWSADTLVMTQAMLTVSLPTTLLRAGEYEIILAGMTDNGPQQLEERYLLDVIYRR